MLNVLISIFLMAGICYGQNPWREKNLSYATTMKDGQECVQVKVELEKGVFTFSPQLRRIIFNPDLFTLGQRNSLYDAAVRWDERDYKNREIITSHPLDSLSKCPISISEESIIDILIEYEVLSIGRSPSYDGFTPSDQLDQLFFSFIYDSVAVVSFLEKCEALPYVLYVNVPLFGRPASLNDSLKSSKSPKDPNSNNKGKDINGESRSAIQQRNLRHRELRKQHVSESEEYPKRDETVGPFEYHRGSSNMSIVIVSAVIPDGFVDDGDANRCINYGPNRLTNTPIAI